MNTKQSKVISLVGAGASISVGIPAMQGIFNDFMDRNKSKISREQKELCKFIIKELNVKEDLEEFLLAANLILESPNSCLLPLIERSISKQKHTIQINNFNSNFLKRINEISELKKEILEFMSRTCFMFDRGAALKYFSNFVDAVSGIGCPIFTTNYDFVYEFVAEEKGIKLHDNFKKSGQRYIWNNDIAYPLGEGCTIIKLHGSVSWYSDIDRNIEKIQTNTDINTMGKSIERMVVFPTRFKDIYDQHFFALYSHFLSSLTQANMLIVIGHSLRDEYLRAAIIERLRKGNFKVVVISPDFPISFPKEFSPTKTGSIGSIIHIPYKFENISDEFAYILKNFELEDISKQVINILNHDKFAKNKIHIKGRLRKLIPGKALDIFITVKALIKRDFKPSFIKVWLETQIKLQDGKLDLLMSKEFLQTNTVLLGDNTTGFIDDEFKIKISIPLIKNWLDKVETVTLKVAILSKDVKKPSYVSENILIASDSKKLKYGR